MALVVLAALLAAVLAVATGGRLRRGSPLGIREVRLLVAALALQVGAALLLPARAGVQVVVLVVSLALAFGFATVNRRLAGLPLVGAGVLANAIVIAANGGMPVSLAAARRAGLRADDLSLDRDPRHVPLGAGTHLRWLGDVIAFPLPGAAELLSVGDVLNAAGVGLAVWTALRAGARSSTGP